MIQMSQFTYHQPKLCRRPKKKQVLKVPFKLNPFHPYIYGTQLLLLIVIFKSVCIFLYYFG